jgi:hypothetical protein
VIPWLIGAAVLVAVIVGIVLLVKGGNSLRDEYEKRLLYEEYDAYMQAARRASNLGLFDDASRYYDRAGQVGDRARKQYGKDPDAFDEYPPSRHSRYDSVRRKDAFGGYVLD